MAEGLITMVACEPDYHNPVKVIRWRDGTGQSRSFKGLSAFLAASGWTLADCLADATFAGAAAKNFGIPPMHGVSPAIGAGNAEVARYYNDLFQAKYGLSIAVDADGHARPDANDRVDIGAYQARPDKGDGAMQWILDYWEVNGKDAGRANPLTIEIDGDVAIVAKAVQSFSIDAGVVPSGAGTVTVTPQKSCYLSGETVTITFTAAAPST